MRDFGVKVKLNPVKELLKGKRVLIMEDSIIRGNTTAKTRVKTLREIGAKEVHIGGELSAPCIPLPLRVSIFPPRAN